MPAGMFALMGLLLLLVLWPIIFTEIMVVALGKLGISPFSGVLIVLGLFLGSLINIPVKRFRLPRDESTGTWTLYGLDRWLPPPREKLIAVNIGGCLIPLGLVLYELLRVNVASAVLAVLGAVSINVVVCFYVSYYEPGRGILMPVLLPGVVAAFCGLVFYPENAPTVAFCAGVLGPLVGADLLHLRQINKAELGIVSIGGAGTFDGIVISGFIALLLS